MKIMAAVDVSEYADFVLIKAIKTARQQQAKLDIFIVAEVDQDPKHPDSAAQKDSLIKKATIAAEKYQQKAIAQGIRTKIRVRSGFSVADEIIRYQQQEQLDLIVIGRKNKSSSTGSPIGTVAQKVAALATSSVLIVRSMEERDR